MILFIDTIDFNKVTFGVRTDKKFIQRTYKIDAHRSYETLKILHEFLGSLKIFQQKKALVDQKDVRLKKIFVNKGPGSYTGVRVGVTIAMAFGLALGVPVKTVAAVDYAKAVAKISQ